MEKVTYGRDLLSQEGSRLCESVGKLMIKDMVAKGINMESFAGQFKEAFNPSNGYMTFKEDVDTSNSGALFITGLAQVIRAAVEPNMIGLELLQLNTDLMNGGGKGAIKLPKEKRITAAVVGEGGSISYTTEGYESITVSPYKIVAASKITWEMVKRGMISMITAEAARVGKALARKVDSDILTAITAVCTSANGNRIATGGATQRVSYNDLIDARALIEGFEVGGFKATHLVLHADDYAALNKDTDFKEALVRAPVIAGNQPGSASLGVFPQIEYFGPQKIIVTNQIASGTSLFVDATELGTFVQESDVEVVDGRISGSVDTEVIALQSYGIG
ncbi:MAG: phage major capsid protein, partial [Candidatus Moranbacteria bacterium]|nr:phage major capsid protein [Candidatus Moranbacteria bacterium]